jgi:hypothetical protein
LNSQLTPEAANVSEPRLRSPVVRGRARGGAAERDPLRALLETPRRKSRTEDVRARKRRLLRHKLRCVNAPNFTRTQVQAVQARWRCCLHAGVPQTWWCQRAESCLARVLRMRRYVRAPSQRHASV